MPGLQAGSVRLGGAQFLLSSPPSSQPRNYRLVRKASHDKRMSTCTLTSKVSSFPRLMLIRNDVAKVLEPKEMRECKDQGPYAVQIMFEWTINSPLERKENYRHTGTSSSTTN